ncbi:MAG: hypothetical protein QOG87_3821 [Actinomycetota bacterium]
MGVFMVIGLLLALPEASGATTAGLVTIRWNRQMTVSPAPTRVEGNAASYYPDANQIVVFGDQDADTSIFTATTSVFDGTDWAVRTPAHSPPGRIQGDMAYDPVSKRLILFGGYANGLLGDTWAWNGTDWTQLSTPTQPSARANHMMSRTANGLVLYGGETTSQYLEDTWRWTGTAWVEEHPVHTPGRRSRGTMDWFPDGAVAVLHAGNDASTWMSDTWAWNGTDWAQVTPHDEEPHLAAYRSNIVYSEVNKTMMIFGGAEDGQPQSTVWLLTGDAWVPHPSTVGPGGRYGATLVYDSTRAATVLIDGNSTALWMLPSPVRSLGGQLIGGPDASSWAPDRVDVFVRGVDNGLWHKWGDDKVWSGWEGLGGQLTADPAAASWGPDRVDVFVRGTDNGLWHKWWDGARWQGWEPLGGILTSAPDVSSWGPNRLDVFVRGADNGLWHKWWDGARWQGWEPLGGTLASEPGVASHVRSAGAQDRVDVFALGTDNGLWHRSFVGAWKPWESLGGSWDSGPDVSREGLSLYDIAVRNGDGVAHRVYQDGPLGEWQSEGVPSTAAPSVASDTGGRQDLFTRGPSGDLLHSRRG